ncbi:MAG: hypothetical protein JXO51_08845 [Candidatus Aminicenantes bacterium]|nr:hypothetical protein [Candidatus Aminicenantes bacterium]
MVGNEVPAAPSQPETGKGAMKVQCPSCGNVQELDDEYKICLNCGGAVDETHTLILKNPRLGRGRQGLAVVAFVLSLFVFFFWSKYLGRHGMAISALFYLWGFYKNYLNRRSVGLVK